VSCGTLASARASCSVNPPIEKRCAHSVTHCVWVMSNEPARTPLRAFLVVLIRWRLPGKWVTSDDPLAMRLDSTLSVELVRVEPRRSGLHRRRNEWVSIQAPLVSSPAWAARQFSVQDKDDITELEEGHARGRPVAR
jgi:hypothetical protein